MRAPHVAGSSGAEPPLGPHSTVVAKPARSSMIASRSLSSGTFGFGMLVPGMALCGSSRYAANSSRVHTRRSDLSAEEYFSKYPEPTLAPKTYPKGGAFAPGP